MGFFISYKSLKLRGMCSTKRMYGYSDGISIFIQDKGLVLLVNFDVFMFLYFVCVCKYGDKYWFINSMTIFQWLGVLTVCKFHEKIKKIIIGVIKVVVVQKEHLKRYQNIQPPALNINTKNTQINKIFRNNLWWNPIRFKIHFNLY